MPTRDDILAALKRGEVRLPPLRLTNAERRKLRGAGGRSNGPDALLTAGWGSRSYRFAVSCSALGTPKAVVEAADMAIRCSSPPDVFPMVLVPFLSQERLTELERRGVSAADLCGNGVVVVPGQLLVWRSGSPNLFRPTGKIKNVYRKDSSIAARLFLLVPRFGSVHDAHQELLARGGRLTLGTVSKVCKALEEDLILERGKGASPTSRGLRLLQADKLLEQLARNHVPPTITREYLGKCRLGPEQLRSRLKTAAERDGGRVILTGAASTGMYAVMAREDVQSFYCTDLVTLVEDLGDDIRETDRFADIRLLQTSEAVVYFDERPDLAASPIQTYLELSAGDRRERQTAEQLRRVILDPLMKAQGEE